MDSVSSEYCEASFFLTCVCSGSLRSSRTVSNSREGNPRLILRSDRRLTARCARPAGLQRQWKWINVTFDKNWIGGHRERKGKGNCVAGLPCHDSCIGQIDQKIHLFTSQQYTEIKKTLNIGTHSVGESDWIAPDWQCGHGPGGRNFVGGRVPWPILLVSSGNRWRVARARESQRCRRRLGWQSIPGRLKRVERVYLFRKIQRNKGHCEGVYHFPI